jgi:hypothetical protein
MMKQAKSMTLFKTSKPRKATEEPCCRLDSPIHQTIRQRSDEVDVVQGKPPSLSKLICKKRWDAVMVVLSSSDANIEIDEKGYINEENILHFALRFHANLQVVKLLSMRFPKCVKKPDLSGKFCTHVAAKYSAHPNVMAYIISLNPAAAGCPDSQGKCPIHYVAEFYVKHGARYHDDVDYEMLEVVRLLKKEAPQSFNVEDDDECNPIEYAIANDAEIRVIKMMQRTARDDWREMKQVGRGTKHEDLRSNLQRSAKQASAKLLRPQVERRSGIIPTPDPSVRNTLKRSFTAKSA